MESLLQDLRHSARALARSPGFTAVALLTLMLGIGANTAIFSVINAVLLRPPFPAAERIVRIWSSFGEGDIALLDTSEGEFLDYREQNKVFDSIGVFLPYNANLTGEGEPERVAVTYASDGFLPTLGVKPARGRLFSPEEDRSGGPQTVVLSHGLWQRRFGSDPEILGKVIQVNGRGVPVVGVMPPGFQFPGKTEMWLPFQIDPANQAPRGQHYLGLLARLKPGVSLEQAQADMSSIVSRFGERYPQQYPPDHRLAVRLVPLIDDMVGGSRQTLLVLFAAVAFVLLIAAVNVANLLLARAHSQEREVAIRMALGAGRRQILQQSLAESLLLTLTGAGLGLLLAHWGLAAFLAVNPDPVPRAAEIDLDGRVLVFTLGLALLTGLVLGLVSAFRAARPDLQVSLKEGSKGSPGLGLHRFRRFLVGFEVAAALVLLVSAGLMIKSFVRLSRVDPGFRADGLLTMELTLSFAHLREDPQVMQFYDELLDRISALPGVRSASSISILPFANAGHRSNMVGAEGMPFRPGDLLPEPEWRVTDYRYFQTMGIPVRGRTFSAADDVRSQPVVIVDEVLARRLWPGQEAVGKRFKIGPPVPDNPNPWLTVVGVARPSRQFGLAEEEDRGVMYLPQLRRPERTQYLVVRSAAPDAAKLADEIRATIRSMNPDQAVSDVKTMEQRLSESIVQPRFTMLLLATFAAIAMLLAAVGIYGLVAYSVGQRTHEIGVRMALGAQRGDVVRMVVGQGMVVVLVGLVSGALAAYWFTRILAGLLYGVEVTDLAIFATVALLLAVVALAANLLPARRATKLEPTIALRYE